jgi:PhnB protein
MTMNIPKGHQTVMPYYMVTSASRFIDFTRKAFEAELVSVTRLSPESDAVIHADLRIGGSTILFADASPQEIDCDAACHEPAAGNPSTIQLFVYVKDADDVCKKAVAAGATTAMEVAEQEDGRMGGIIDPFGNLWWIKSLT